MNSNGKREFAASDIAGALSYIKAMPDAVRRVLVDVWDGGWEFVYGDDRSHVPDLLEMMVRGRRFRVRIRNLR